MLCDKTFQVFHIYFTTGYNFGFVCFKWNNKRRFFNTKFSTTDWKLKLWFLNNLILFLKSVFLAIQVYHLNQTGQTSKLIFENSFMITFFNAFVHNLLYWKKGTGVPLLYWRCVSFSNVACGKSKSNFTFKLSKKRFIHFFFLFPQQNTCHVKISDIL